MSSEPQFEPQRVDSVEIISEEALVANEAQVFVQSKRGLVRYLRFQNDLKNNVGGK